VSDGCGNESSAIAVISFVDDKAPVPICVAGVSTVFMESDGSVDVWAVDFDLGSFDNCTDLDFTIVTDGEDPIRPGEEGFETQRNFKVTCEDLTQLYPLDVWVWDEGGNGDFCNIEILISGNCDNVSSSSFISGSITNKDDNGIEDVEVLIESDQLAEYPKSLLTDETGRYTFNNNPTGQNYALLPAKNDNHVNGMSTLDLIVIQKHLLGLTFIDSPYDIIAADANNDQHISAADIIIFRDLILGLKTRLELNQSWRFIPKDFAFVDASNPWPFTDQINIIPLQSNSANNDFIGIKIGDVSGDAVPNSIIETEIRSRGIFTFNTDAVSFHKGDLIEVPVYAKDMNKLDGFQMTLKHEGLMYTGVNSESFKLNDDHIGIHDDQLTFSWNGDVSNVDDVLFYIGFIAQTDGSLKNALEVNSSITKAQAYTDGKILDVTLEFNDVLSDQFEVFQNDPNPFSETSTIKFKVPVQSDLEISIFDVNGKVIKTHRGNYSKGTHSLIMNRDELPVSGVIFYQLKAGSYTSRSFKAVIID
jgi:hypothetical protein